MLRGRALPWVLATVTPLVFTAVACGVGKERGSGGTTTVPEPAGKALSRSYGCAACHGPNGEGGTGPTWVGLFGSEVTLTDGSTVVADEEYLRRSIVDPAAQVPEGVTLPMPVNASLTPQDLDELVEYIKSLGG